MICKKCGAYNIESDDRCFNCKSELQHGAITPEQFQRQLELFREQAEEYASTPEKPRRKHRLFLIALPLLAVLCVVLALLAGRREPLPEEVLPEQSATESESEEMEVSAPADLPEVSEDPPSESAPLQEPPPESEDIPEQSQEEAPPVMPEGESVVEIVPEQPITAYEESSEE